MEPRPVGASRRAAQRATPLLGDLPAPPPGRTGWPWTEAPTADAGATLADGQAWPRISIVTPSFNQGEFLEETIRSVLLQGYPNLEYLVLDGGSTDDSLEIIRKYAPWLDYWVSGPDGGQAQAIDAGFDRSEGEILAWLNSDDVYEPGALRRAAFHIQQHPEAMLVYGDADEIARDGTSLGLSPQVRACDRHYLVTEFIAIVQPAAFIPRAAYQAAGGLDHALYWTLDYDLWIKLAGLGPLVYVRETLARTRLYAEAKTGSGRPGMFAEVKTVAERYGGVGLPRQFAQWHASLKLPEALAAFRQGDLAAGQAGLAYVIANAPDWRSEARLAEMLAGEAWRRIHDAGEAPETALGWARQICRGLPEAFVVPSQVEQRVLGLLYEALAFESYRQGRAAEGRRLALRAVAHDPRRAANRGLWAMTIRSLIKA